MHDVNISKRKKGDINFEVEPDVGLQGRAKCNLRNMTMSEK